MFESIIVEYLDKTLSKEYSIMEILKFARPKLSVDTIEDFKDELYAVLQQYNDKVNVHANARKKVKKLLDNFNSSFSSVEMKKFVYELEYHEEVRVNVTSAYTVEVLKDQRENQERINQLRRNTSENSKEEDHVREKVTRPLEVQDDHLCKRQCRQEHIPEYLAEVVYEEAESSSGKQTWQGNDFAPESELLQDHYENNSIELLWQSDLRNSQEESVEYDVEAIRNLLNESETYSQEMNKISSSFRTYQHETRNILSENGIMDLSPTSEFVLLYTEETDYDKLIKEVFESINKMFLEKAHEFLTNFFSEKLNEDQWEEKLESLMENGSPEDFCQQSGENPRQDKFITKLKIFMLETLPTFFDAYKLMSENPLKDREMAEDEYMNTFVHPILKKALLRFSGIRYVSGNKAIKASAYRKTIMNQDGKADRADGIAYTSNLQNSYEISVVEGSRPYVTETNKETSDYIQNARAAKDMINYAVTQEVLHKRPLPSYFRTFMVQVFEFNIQFYFMDYLAQYCIFEIETCEIPIDWKETLQFTSFYRAIVTWALLVGEADKKFQQSRNKRSSRLSNCHNIRKVLKLSHNKARGKKKDMTMTKLI